MFDKLKRFWTAFWSSLKTAYNKAFKNKPESNVQGWRDISAINFLAIFVTKLNNLVNSEATFDVESDSTQAERLKTLCKDLESKRFDITGGMLADGNYYVFPATNEKGELIHSYLASDQVRILNADGDDITEAYGVIDWYTDNDNKDYFLLRHHELDTDGTLTVSYAVVDKTFKPATLAKWEQYKDETYKFVGANHIGFGWYKSPADSRGLSPIYGVPLNFGCEEIEKKIFNDLKLIDDEFKNGKSVIFTDPRNVLKDTETKGYKIAENIIPIQQRAGQSGANIDIFNPTLRYSEHYSKLVGDMALYERQVGTSKGILTDNETSYTATATAIKRSNSDTIALIDKIRNAVDLGNKMTLEADAVFMNVSADLWSYNSDYIDPFADMSEQWQMLKDAHSIGAITTKRMTKWLNPSMSNEDVEKELEAVEEENKANTNNALNRILSGE